MRDGTIDFLVTSLDEALRILKNEIRKRQPVSVAVALEPDQVTRQMLERGVLPDLLRVDLRNTDQHIDQPAADFPSAGFSSSTQDFLDQGALRIPERRTGPYGFWCASRDSASWMPKLDDCVRASIALDLQRERWLRLAPRYLGRTALKLHGVALAGEDQARVRSRLTALSAEAADGSERSGQMLPALEISFGLL